MFEYFKKTIGDGLFLNKELCANGISLRETVKFSLALF